MLASATWDILQQASMAAATVSFIQLHNNDGQKRGLVKAGEISINTSVFPSDFQCMNVLTKA